MYADAGGVAKIGRTRPRGVSSHARSDASGHVCMALDPLWSRTDFAWTSVRSSSGASGRVLASDRVLGGRGRAHDRTLLGRVRSCCRASDRYLTSSASDFNRWDHVVENQRWGHMAAIP